MPSVGLTVVGPQVGTAIWSFNVTGSLEEWDWGAGGPQLRDLLPTRRIGSSTLSRHVPVQSSSMTNRGVLALESGLEHELATFLDRQAAIDWLVAQPAKLKWEDGLTHHPDLLSVDVEGAVTVWDARAVERRDEDFSVKASRTQTACQRVGWGYSLFAGLPQVESLNLRWIAGARRVPEWLDVTRGRILQLVAGGPVPVGQVMAADDGRGFLVSAMWHLVWTGELVMDLSIPWDSSTLISSSEEVTS